MKEAPYPRNASRGGSFYKRHRERASGSFVIPECMGDEGLEISGVHILIIFNGVIKSITVCVGKLY